MATFKLADFDEYGKRQFIECSEGDIELVVDWDDVNHYETAVLLRKALCILNDNWNDPRYTDLDVEPVTSTNDEEAEKLWEARYREAKEIMRSLAHNDNTNTEASGSSDPTEVGGFRR